MDVVMATNDGSDRCLLSLPLSTALRALWHQKGALRRCTIQSTRMDSGAKLLQAHPLRCHLQAVSLGLLLLAGSQWAQKDPIVAVANTLYSSDELCKEGALQQGPLQGFVFKSGRLMTNWCLQGASGLGGKIPLWQSPTHCTALMMWQRGPPRPHQRRRPGETWRMERGLKMLRAQTWWT